MEKSVKKKKYKNGNLEQDMEKLDSIIVPSHAQLLFCPPLTLSLLGEIGGGGGMWKGRKPSKWLVSHVEPLSYSS